MSPVEDLEEEDQFSNAGVPPPVVVNRRRATDDRQIADWPHSVADDDEGDFILRRESDFGLRRNVARKSETSQRTRHHGDLDPVRDAAGGGSDPAHSERHESGEPVPLSRPAVTSSSSSGDGSRRTGLPTSRRALSRQRENQDSTAVGFPEVTHLRGSSSHREGEAAETAGPESFESGNVGAPAATPRLASLARQRLRQEPSRTASSAVAVDEPSARAAAAEGRSSTSSSAAAPSNIGRARSQFQRARPAPPEAPLAVVLPRSGHSASGDEATSSGGGQQVQDTRQFIFLHLRTYRKAPSFSANRSQNVALCLVRNIAEPRQYISMMRSRGEPVGYSRPAAEILLRSMVVLALFAELAVFNRISFFPFL